MNTLPFDYTLTRKNVKNINCRIKDGTVFVSANKNVPIPRIEQFLLSKSNFILEALQKQSKKPEISIENNSHIQILNADYTIKISKSQKNSITLSNDTINIYVVDINDTDKIQNLFDIIIKELSKKVIEPLCNETFLMLLQSYNIKNPEIKYKKLKSMWGNCNAKKGAITFSTNLMFTNIDFVRYVVLHEYVHLIHQHHQKPFYDVVKKYMPNYKEIKGNLYD